MTENELIKKVHESSVKLNKLLAQRVELSREIEYAETEYEYYKHKLLEAQDVNETQKV